MLEIYLIICCVVLSVWYLRCRSRQTEISNLPPGKMGLPFIGETLSFAREKIHFFKSRHDKYGKVFKTNLFGKPTIRVHGSDNLRKIMLNEARFVESCYPTSVRKLLGEDSISMSQGDSHVTKKQQLMRYLCPAFFQHHVPVFSSIIADRIEAWQTLDEIDLHKESRKLFIELALRLLIKLDIAEEDLDVIRKQLDIFTENIFCLPINLPGFAFRKALNAKKELRRFFQTFLAEHSHSDNNNNNVGELCSVLEDLRSKHGGKGDVKQEELFLDTIIELLFTGAETVSSAGFTVAYQLTKNKNFISNLKEELQQHDLRDKSQTICLNDLKAMDYLEAVVNESLRTIPPIGGFFRKVKETFELECYTVPQGWTLAFGIRDTHHSDSGSRTSEFNPDKWLKQSSSIDKYSFLPFGTGLRKCPGQAYAKIVLKLFVIELTRTNEATIVKDSALELWPTPRPADHVTVTFKHATKEL